MTQTFDETGVGYVQNFVLALLAADLLLECQFLRSDFAGWMNSRFNLHFNQQQQLLTMPTSLKNALANGIANSWERGVAVNFIKETKSEDDVPDQKEMVIMGLDAMIAVNNTSSPIIAVPILIHIRYKYQG